MKQKLVSSRQTFTGSPPLASCATAEVEARDVLDLRPKKKKLAITRITQNPGPRQSGMSSCSSCFGLELAVGVECLARGPSSRCDRRDFSTDSHFLLSELTSSLSILFFVRPVRLVQPPQVALGRMADHQLTTPFPLPPQEVKPERSPNNGVKKETKKKGKSLQIDKTKKKPGRKASKLTKTGRRRQRRDPDAPKRARTAFNFFLMEFRQKYLVRDNLTAQTCSVDRSIQRKKRRLTFFSSSNERPSIRRQRE